jgi:hypothetical protein
MYLQIVIRKTRALFLWGIIIIKDVSYVFYFIIDQNLNVEASKKDSEVYQFPETKKEAAH